MTRYDYVVIGNPVSHSRSPEIHGMFAAQTGERMNYGRLLAEDFVETVEDFFSHGGLGANVTVPFKSDAAGWVDQLDASAQFAQAVNTIVCRDKTYYGYNTDGPGLIADLRRQLGRPLAGARILLLGAGGAVRGVLTPLAAEIPESITIANRTPATAQLLVTALKDAFPDLAAQAREFSALTGGYDLVINGTSAGLNGAVAGIADSVVAGAFCYDMGYGAQTAFCRFADAAGAAAVVDGLGMLVEQAALAFELWRGKMPDAGAVLEALRAADSAVGAGR